MKTIHRSWYLLFIIYFGLLLVANLVFPITFDDDFFYSKAGNPFSLQWQEYVTVHSRILSHTILRIIRQLNISDGFLALLGALLPFLAYFQVNPNYLYNNSKKDRLLFILLSSLIFGFISISWSAYTFAAYFMSNIFSKIMILAMLIPYRKLLDNPHTTISPWFYIVCFLTGATHEMSIILLPLLIIWFLTIHFLQKNPIPKWAFTGLIIFLLGSLVIFLAPSMKSSHRLINYGGAENWYFMGQHYNWLELGLLRYWYSFLQAMLFNTFAYIPNSAPYLILWIITIVTSIRTHRGFNSQNISSLLMFTASIGFISVMMFSPLYYSANLNWGMIFLFIALISALRDICQQERKWLKPLTYTAMTISLFIYVLSFFAWNHYRKEYNDVVKSITQAKKDNTANVSVKAFTQFTINTPFGAILPVYLYRTPGFYQRMADYYKSPPIQDQ